MATIALVAIAQSAANSAGWSVFHTAILSGLSAAAGSFIDNKFLLPKLFGSNNPENTGLRQDDLQVTTASEGSPENYAIGPENLIAGTIIWAPDMELEVTEEEVGGKGGGGGGQTIEERHYHASCAVSWGRFQASRIRKIWADEKLIYDADAQGAPVDGRRVQEGITNYLGTQDQTPDPKIEEYLGAGDVPAYRGRCYSVLKKINLADFGNRIPNFTALVEADSGLTIGQAIGRILGRTGLAGLDYDVSRLAGCLTGYRVAGPQSARRMLPPLLLAHDITVREGNAQLTFEPRSYRAIAVIPEEDLANGEEGSASVPQLKITDPPDVTLPSRCTVTFPDLAHSYERGSVTEVRNSPYAEGTIQLNVPIPMKATQARHIARQALWRPLTERQLVEFSLPHEWMHLQEDDVVRIDLGNDSYYVRLREINRGANFRLELTGTLMRLKEAEDEDGSDDDDADDREDDGEPVFEPVAAAVAVLDLPALRSSDLESTGVYYGICAADPDDPWFGAGLYRSTNAVTYGQVATALNEVRMGEVVGKLGDGPVGYWDNANVLEVRMFHGELSSAGSDLEVYSGNNAAIVFDPATGRHEVIGYRYATLVGEGQYRLTRLLRGLRDTRGYVGGHVSGERIIVPTSAFGFSALAMSHFGNAVYYKGVSAGQAVDDGAAAVVPKFEARTKRPFTPCFVKGSRDGSNNLAVTWLRRTRAIARIFSTSGVPQVESSIEYEIEFLSGPGGPVLRTKAVTSESAGYTAAEQTADGLTPGNAVTVRIYQISSAVGRGNPAEVTI